MSQVTCPSLVGREEEWGQLQGALDDAGRGRGALLCLVGEAGIGKSRLSSEFAAAARERGLRVLTGRAVDTGTPVPFRALFEALSGYFREAGAVDGPDVDVIRPALAQLVPRVAE